MSQARSLPAALGIPVRLRVSETPVAILAFALLALVPALFQGYPVYILPQYMLYGVLASLACAPLGLCRIGQLWAGRILHYRCLCDRACDEA
jgi:hypothetical protein